ncbi:hypothetical protein CS535_22575 [Yersinia massiliensis]|nr:hypothetical protein CS535_22575 [Yersinia massiliensis]
MNTPDTAERRGVISGKRRGQGRCKRDVDVQDRLLSDRTETLLCGSAEAGLRHRRGTAEVQATSRPFTGGEPFGGHLMHVSNILWPVRHDMGMIKR